MAELELSAGFGWVGNIITYGGIIFVLGGLAFLAWFVWTRYMNFPYQVFIEERRGNIAIPKVLKGRFERSKEGKHVLTIKGMPGHIGSVSYSDVLPGNKIRLYRVNESEFKALHLPIEEDNPLYMPRDDEQMRFAYASAIEHIWLMTQPSDLMAKYGHIVWLVVAAVLFIVVMWSPMQASGEAAQAYAQASQNFKAATDNLLIVAGSRSTATVPPVP